MSNVDLFNDNTGRMPEPAAEPKIAAVQKEVRGEDFNAKPDLFSSSDATKESDDASDDVKEAVESVESTKSEKSTKEPKKSEEKQEVKTEESEKKTDSAKVIKKLLAKIGDSELEIAPDARFKHKVDSEEVEVTLQDLLNNYSGKQSWDKKFTELDKERQSHKADLENVNKYISEFAKKSKEDPVAALEFLASEIGLDPYEYRKTLRQQLTGKYADYVRMEQEQRAMYEQKEELEYLRSRRESESKRIEAEQAKMELEQKFRSIQEAHAISDERRSFLEKELVEGYKLEANPANVLELHNSLSRLEKVEKALSSVNPEFLNDDDKIIALESLLRGNSKMTDEQLSDMAKRLYGSKVEKAIKNLSKKLETDKPRAAANSNKNNNLTKPKRVGSNALDFFND